MVQALQGLPRPLREIRTRFLRRLEPTLEHDLMSTTGLRTILVLFTVGLATAVAVGQTDTLRLPRLWRFSPGDDSTWAKPSFRDRAWKTILIGQNWERQGYEGYDGIAWYRTHIVIPASLVKKSYHRAGIKIMLGRIDDSDSTFLNGKFIGATDSWDLLREYVVAPERIIAGKSNTLAIRVNDTGGGGGMYASPYGIAPITATDCLRFRSSPADSRLLHRGGAPWRGEFLLKNLLRSRVSGVVHVRVAEAPTGRTLLDTGWNATIRGREEMRLACDFIATTSPRIRISLDFTDPAANQSTAPTIFTSCLSGPPNPVKGPVHPLIDVPVANLPFSFGNEMVAGLLGERIGINLADRLLKVDEERLLRGFYQRPGEQDWIGEHVGKYLQAAVNTWLVTGNDSLKSQMDRMVNILISCQDSDGYLGTYADQDRWTRWDVWVHKYDLVGLLSYYAATGYEPALMAARRIGDLMCSTFGDLPGQRDIIAAGEWNGLAATSIIDPMMDLYRWTADPRYLDFCHFAVLAYNRDGGSHLLDALLSARSVMAVANQKAYEMLSNIHGLLKLYQVTGERPLLEAATYAWRDIVENRLYITGSASASEQFRSDHHLPGGAGDHICEGCVTTTWLQVNQLLMNLTGEARYADEIERTVYNHLLGAENPVGGCVANYAPLQGVKPFSCDISCCLSSIVRGISFIPGLVWQRRSDAGMNIMLLTAGTLADSIRVSTGTMVAVKVETVSSFPESGGAEVIITTSVPSTFPVYIRVPEWAREFQAVCGGTITPGKPGSFMRLEQTWGPRSAISLLFSVNVRTVSDTLNYPDRIGFVRGPQVLALDLSLNPGGRDEADVMISSDSLFELRPAEHFLPAGWVGQQVYAVRGTVRGKEAPLLLVPFADAGQTGGDIRVWIRKR